MSCAPELRLLVFGGLGNNSAYFGPLEKACGATDNINQLVTVDIQSLDPRNIDDMIAVFLSDARAHKGTSVVVGFSSSCYAAAVAFEAHRRPNSRLLLIDPPYILGPGELPHLAGIHPYYRNGLLRAEVPREARNHVHNLLAPSAALRVLFGIINVCPPVQWALRAAGPRASPWEVDRAIYSTPAAVMQKFLTRFVLAYDPVEVIESVDPERTRILCTRYPMSREFIEKRPRPVSECVCYIDSGHHVLHDRPEMVTSILRSWCATSRP